MLLDHFEMSRIFLLCLFFALFANMATSAATNKQGKFSGMERMNEPEIASCLRSKVCPVALILEPICASDGRTYPSRGTIKCLNECLKPDEQVAISSGGYCKNDIIE